MFVTADKIELNCIYPKGLEVLILQCHVRRAPICRRTLCGAEPSAIMKEAHHGRLHLRSYPLVFSEGPNVNGRVDPSRVNETSRLRKVQAQCCHLLYEAQGRRSCSWFPPKPLSPQTTTMKVT